MKIPDGPSLIFTDLNGLRHITKENKLNLRKDINKILRVTKHLSEEDSKKVFFKITEKEIYLIGIYLIGS